MSVKLSFTDVSRHFTGEETTVALEKVSLELEQGSFTAIIGPSGCGKSTLLHIAAGLDTQYEGTFIRSPEDAKVACLFQSPRLLPWMSAYDNVLFILKSCGWNHDDASKQASGMLDMVGLTRFHDRFPTQLSGGMQQRVALARALAVEPGVLLMDEPFAALDELTARRLREELIQLCHPQERTIMFVTHNIFEACYLADRVVVMSAHPGTIKTEIPIDIERPREFDDVRISEYCSEVYGYIEDGWAANSNGGH